MKVIYKEVKYCAMCTYSKLIKSKPINGNCVNVFSCTRVGNPSKIIHDVANVPDWCPLPDIDHSLIDAGIIKS